MQWQQLAPFTPILPIAIAIGLWETSRLPRRYSLQRPDKHIERERETQRKNVIATVWALQNFTARQGFIHYRCFDQIYLHCESRNLRSMLTIYVRPTNVHSKMVRTEKNTYRARELPSHIEHFHTVHRILFSTSEEYSCKEQYVWCSCSGSSSTNEWKIWNS